MPRFIVIGGGAIGLNTAYQLARRQAGSVILLEKGQVGDGSSSRAGGIITGLLWSETGVLARLISLRLYQELTADLEQYGYRFQNVGCLNLFDPSSWPQREELLPLYDRLDFAYEIFDAAGMRRRWPDLTPESDQIGLHDALGGYSEPHEFVPALARRCRDSGVEIRENARVNGLQIENGRVVGVQTALGVLEADVVICTVHAWTRSVYGAVRLETADQVVCSPALCLFGTAGTGCDSRHKRKSPWGATFARLAWGQPTSAYWPGERPKTGRRSASTILLFACRSFRLRRTYAGCCRRILRRLSPNWQGHAGRASRWG